MARFIVLRTALDTIRFNELLTTFELSGRGDAFLINHEGIIQTPTLYQNKVFEKIPFAVPEYSDNTEIREEINTAGEPIIICSAYIPDSPYILIIVKHKDDLMKSWRETRLKLIGFLVVSITVILLAILGFSTYLVNNVYLARPASADDPARDGILQQTGLDRQTGGRGGPRDQQSAGHHQRKGRADQRSVHLYRDLSRRHQNHRPDRFGSVLGRTLRHHHQAPAEFCPAYGSHHRIDQPRQGHRRGPRFSP